MFRLFKSFRDYNISIKQQLELQKEREMASSNHLFIGSIIHWKSMDEIELLTDGFIAVQDGEVKYQILTYRL